MRAFPALLLALAVGACALARPEGPPPPESPVPLPSGWTAGAGSATDADRSASWWEDFGDPVLTGLVREALTKNPEMTAAAARVRRAEALARVAGADALPSVAAGTGAARSRSFTGAVSELFPPTTTSSSYGASLDVSWEADLWGRIESGKLAAAEDVTGSRAARLGVRLSLAAQTAKAYFAVVDAERQLAIARENRESAAALEQRIRDRFASGLRSALDVKLAQSETAAAESAVANRARVLDATVRQLEILAGRYPAADAKTAGSLPPLPPSPPAGLPADILSRRPDIAVAEHAVRAAAARVGEARAALYPRLSLTGSGGLASDDLGDLLGGDFSVWSLAAGLAAPIFSGGRLRANVDATRAGEDEVSAAFATRVLTALAEVETALAAERTLAARFDAARDLLAAAEASRSLAEERYLAGLTDVVAVLEARRRAYSAESELSAARRARLENRIDLHVSLGGGFAPNDLSGIQP